MKYILFLQEPRNEAYKKLIEYASKICDAMLFVIRYDNVVSNISRFDEICKLMHMSKNKLLDEYINNINISDKIKNVTEEMCLTEKVVEDTIKTYSKNNKKYIYTRNKMDKIKEKLKSELILERHNPEWCGNGSVFITTNNFKEKDINIEQMLEIEYKYKGDYIYDICFYKTTDKIKKFLLEKNSLYEFMLPALPEDVCFFKNGYAWLRSSTHDKSCGIYIENEQEISVLKEIGLKFEEYECSKEDVPYENY